MPELLLRDIDDAIVQRLNEQAVLHGHSLEVEAIRILEDNLLQKNRVAFLEEIRTFKSSLPPQTTDSTDIIREDRDSR